MNKEDQYKRDITYNARHFVQKMKAVALVYCSSYIDINIGEIFQMIIATEFDLKQLVTECHSYKNRAIIEFLDSIERRERKKKKKRKEEKKRKNENRNKK